MRQANGNKRLSAADKRRLEAGENVQPALVNSAVAAVGDPLPEGNWKECVNEVRRKARTFYRRDGSTLEDHRAVQNYVAEFEARARVMPFIRFCRTGSALPVEIGNVDKVQALDGSGTYYMFPTSKNLEMAFAGDPEDPTQGQEAQGGPLHGITGRGEKYAGGNVETDMVADKFKKPAAEGKGSQTGGTGIQRATLGDASAVVSAVEDDEAGNTPDQYFGQNSADYADGHPARPLTPGTTVRQVKKGKEPGVIRRSHNTDAIRTKGDAFEVVKEKTPKEFAKANIDNGQPHIGKPGKATVVDTKFADVMKEGQKTATDAAAAGAVTAGNSAADIEQKSPGTVNPGGRQSDDQSEGTTLDTLQPTIHEIGSRDPMTLGAMPAVDWDEADEKDIREFLDKHNVHVTQGATRTDLVALAKGESNGAGDGLARQKSDEATPQAAGGVLVAGGLHPKVGEHYAEKANAERRAESKADSKADTPKRGGVRITTGKKSTAKNGKKTVKSTKSADQKAEEQKLAATTKSTKDDDLKPKVKKDEPGVVKTGPDTLVAKEAEAEKTPKAEDNQS
jgi:hypothetical protein